MYYKVINTHISSIKRKRGISLVAGWLLSCLIPLAGQNIHLFPGISMLDGRDTANYQVALKENIPVSVSHSGEKSSTDLRAYGNVPARFPALQEFVAGFSSPRHEYLAFFILFALKRPVYQVIPFLTLATGKRLVFRGKAGILQNNPSALADN